MAFSILGKRFWKTDTQPAAEATENTAIAATRRAVLKKTMPTQRLIDQKNPHVYVNAASTDVARHWRK